MGDHHSKELLKKLVPRVDGTVLEIGSLDNGDGKSTQLRDFYTDGPYYGIDIQAGNNVDYVADICSEFESIINEDLFFHKECSLIFAISVLEHLAKPWYAAWNLTYLLQKNGLLFISVPWIWRWHGYPDDYFRYSFSGIKSLFPNFEWLYEGSSSQDGVHTQYKDGKYSDNNRIYKINTLNGKEKCLPYTMINMLGRKL